MRCLQFFAAGEEICKWASRAVTASSDRLPIIDDDASLATRAAWLYFAAGLTQSEVAVRLNIQSTKAHRLIARASREGMIRVFVEGPVAECVALENTLAQRLGLAFCRLAVTLHGGQIWVEDNNPKGACFHVRLPASPG